MKIDANAAAIKPFPKDTTIAPSVTKKDSITLPPIVTPKEPPKAEVQPPAYTMPQASVKPAPVDSVILMLMAASERLKKAKLEDLGWIAGGWESRDRQSIVDEYWM